MQGEWEDPVIPAFAKVPVKSTIDFESHDI
jgi:hypothetical protein